MAEDLWEASSWKSVNTVFTNSKAGMESVNNERVQHVVYELSKGSSHFANEQRKEVCRFSLNSRES